MQMMKQSTIIHLDSSGWGILTKQCSVTNDSKLYKRVNSTKQFADSSPSLSTALNLVI